MPLLAETESWSSPTGVGVVISALTLLMGIVGWATAIFWQLRSLVREFRQFRSEVQGSRSALHQRISRADDRIQNHEVRIVALEVGRQP